MWGMCAGATKAHIAFVYQQDIYDHYVNRKLHFLNFWRDPMLNYNRIAEFSFLFIMLVAEFLEVVMLRKKQFYKQLGLI